MKYIIVIVGPTGVGKTKLSIALAHHYHGEIINADSTQVYKYLDIATAKIKKEEMEGIPHHLIDIKGWEDNYTVYDFQRDARKKVEEIRSRSHVPIIVGGTGLYINALLYDYQFEEENENISYENISTERLWKMLKEVDPYTVVHQNNRRRIERALTYYYNHGVPMSEKKNLKKPIYPALVLGLTMDRDKIYERINLRVDEMVANGLLEEAKKVYDSKVRSKAIMTPIGYKELFPYFDGTESLTTCIDKIKQNSRRYAKRQYTWFCHQLDVTWFQVNEDSFSSVVEDIKMYMNRFM